MSSTSTNRTDERIPLVSCIMPTQNRKDFVIQSICYFRRQDYKNRELLILDSSSEPFEGYAAEAESVRYFHVSSEMRIGAKRNLGCQHARGTYIAHWDDDDWYAPQRLTKQMAPLLAGSCDISGLGGGTIFELGGWEFWRSPYVRKVLEGTIAYSRSVWFELARFPNMSFGECGAFLAEATRLGAVLEIIPSNELFLYVIHGDNISDTGIRRYPKGWFQISEPAIPSSDRAFYRSRKSAYVG